MNKTIFAIIILIIIVGAAFAIWKIYFSPQKPAPAPVMPLTSDQRQPSSATVLSQPTPTSSVTLPPTTKPPVTSQGVLDRIEAAIRAKLKR